MTIRVEKLVTYPIKGLSGQVLGRVMLEAARGFPLDRAFAFARYDSGMDPANPRPMPKSQFLVLARDAALARLNTKFDTKALSLSLHDGETDLTFDLSSADGITKASTYLSGVVGLPPEQRPDFIQGVKNGGDVRFTDVCMKSTQMMHCISIINLASVRAFGEAVGRDVDPHRFRGNLMIDGLPPFAEFDMIDQEIQIGTAKLRVLSRIRRCPATQVNLQTAKRDLDVPALLDEHYGHRDMGVYAEVIAGSDISVGDDVSLR